MRVATTLGWIAAALTATALVASDAAAGQQTFVLEDHINREWRRELVSFPVTFEKDICRADSLSLRGPNGAVACQLTDVTHWPGGTFARSATLWFIGDAPKLTRNEYVLSYADKPTAIGQPKTDLKVTRRKDQVEFTSKHFGIRLLLGKKSYRKPAAAKNVPGPVLAFKSGDGKWFGGGSRLYGPLKMSGYRARMLEEGPVLARWAVRYTYADKNTLTLTVTMAAGDNTVFFEQTADRDAVDIARTGNIINGGMAGGSPKDNGVRIGISRGLAPLVFRCHKEYYDRRPFFKAHKTKIHDWADIPLGPYKPGVVTHLVPWRDWWSTYTQGEIRLRRTDRKSELRVLCWDGGAWVEPKQPPPLQGAGAKAVPLVKKADGSIVMSVSTLAGVRKFSFGETGIPKKDVYRQVGYKFGRARRLWQWETNDPRVGRGLNIAKDYVLEWDEPAGAGHPRMFISADELKARQPELRKDKKRIAELRKEGKIISSLPGVYEAYAMVAYLRTGDAKIGRELKLAQRLGKHLNLLGEYDIRGAGLYMACSYDGLIDSPLITPKQRKLFRAQMAFTAYKWADPGTWSAERGFCGGNPNMTVVIEMIRGLMACMLRTHPESANWGKAAVKSMKGFMKQVGPKGEWHESIHYSHTSTSTLLPFAIAARRAKLYDFLADEDGKGPSGIKRLLSYLAKSYTPADPQRGGRRVTPPWGRATCGADFGHTGVMAAVTAGSDPAFSRQMQWIWKRTGYSLKISHYGQRFGGFEELLADRKLPEQTPDWGSERFPKVGVVMRHGLGTPYEHYLSVLTEPGTTYAVRGTEAGAVTKWFCRGVPIGGAFADGYDHRHQIFMSSVQPSRQRGEMSKLFDVAAYYGKSTVHSFAPLPGADYLDYQFDPHSVDKRWAGSGIKTSIPEWPPILGKGKLPMTWRRQLLLVKDVDPAKTSYMVLRDTVGGKQPNMWQFWTLSEKIGTPEQVRDRKRFLADKPGNKPVESRELKGDRFTAIGQFGMDTEYYIAAPTDTPRHTLRCGEKYGYPIKDLQEFQDLLHLQLPGDGHYFVVLFPRLPRENVPTFETLAEGTVVKITGDFGTDYAFLSDKNITAMAEEATFAGTVGSVQDRKDGLILSLGAAGRVGYKDQVLESDGAVGLSVGQTKLSLGFSPNHKDQTVTLKTVGRWKPAGRAPASVKVTKTDGGYRLTVPAGVSSVVLNKE